MSSARAARRAGSGTGRRLRRSPDPPSTAGWISKWRCGVPPSASPVSADEADDVARLDAAPLDCERRVRREVRVVELVALRVAQPEAVAADPVEADGVQRPVGDREERRSRRPRRCPRRGASRRARRAAARRSCRRTTPCRRSGRRSRPTRAAPMTSGATRTGPAGDLAADVRLGARGGRLCEALRTGGAVVPPGIVGGRRRRRRSATDVACALPTTISLPAGSPPWAALNVTRSAVTDACAPGGPVLRVPLDPVSTVSVPQSSSDARRAGRARDVASERPQALHLRRRDCPSRPSARSRPRRPTP